MDQRPKYKTRTIKFLNENIGTLAPDAHNFPSKQVPFVYFNIMLGEVSERQTLYDITYMWNQKIIQMNVYAKQKQTHKYRKQTCGYQWREGQQEDRVWD